MRRSPPPLFLAVLFGVVTPQAGFAQSDVAAPPEVYAGRRARLMEQVGRHPIVVPGEYLIRARDGRKQDLNFWYLTGVEAPYAVVLLAPAEGGDGVREMLFLPEPFQFAGAQYPMADDRFRHAAWNRPIRRLSPGDAAERATGIAETYPLALFTETLREVVAANDTVFIVRRGESLYAPPGLAAPRSLRQQFEDAVIRELDGHTIVDAAPLVRRMRLVKDASEIAALRRAAEISARSMIDAMRAIEPGVNDLEIAGLMEYAWKREGSPRPSFGSIVSSGAAAVSLYTLKAENYNSTDHVMADGELVFIDYGAAEWDMYTSDVCRTFPVSGTFTPDQRRYYEIVLEAQDSAFASIAPGVMMLEVIKAAARVFQRHGLAEYEDVDRMGVDRVWGIMPSPTHYLERDAGLTPNYSGARGTGVRDLGHHVGLDALDGRDYSMPLQPGMVFTVEPKLYIPELNIAIMIEDVILVTDTGYENLSALAPRGVREIERIMAGGG